MSASGRKPPVTSDCSRPDADIQLINKSVPFSPLFPEKLPDVLALPDRQHTPVG